ncbi:predicted protein [Plenodomus lingam JN3]|uniref:Predicted protein n=1 Tax=Leptosphaeria maculans (strain JN3 / isolate v23.1.3 / race Av1-4-5-6-7-8) TaxID=985895 RepID=E4ZHQ1_LEPMJ|nr:predicted protein [Plenodomus lingam JN3]CBX90884.1 predicted protein [Plenodomus lingam JN3]
MVALGDEAEGLLLLLAPIRVGAALDNTIIVVEDAQLTEATIDWPVAQMVE